MYAQTTLQFVDFPSPSLIYLFVTKMAPITPTVLESILPPHPTAARRPHQIVVEYEDAKFSIASKYTDHGADVVIVNGQYIVKPTARSYEFQTKRKVSKTGTHLCLPICYRIYTDIVRFVVQVNDDWHRKKQRHDPRRHRPCQPSQRCLAYQVRYPAAQLHWIRPPCFYNPFGS